MGLRSKSLEILKILPSYYKCKKTKPGSYALIIQFQNDFNQSEMPHKPLQQIYICTLLSFPYDLTLKKNLSLIVIHF